jgi:hypothetical protein
MATDTKYTIAVQDKNRVWTPVAGEYTDKSIALDTAHAIHFAYRILLGYHSPPIMVQQWEREIYQDQWKQVQWHLLEGRGTGLWQATRP